MNLFLLNGSLIALGLFGLLSPIDGVYFHLFKYKLQENPDSKKEHLVHTLRAITFIPIVLMLFYWNLSGWLLWVLTFLIIVDMVIAAIDIWEERQSRSKIGGLSSAEYLLHAVLITLHTLAMSLALASKPAEAWTSEMQLPVYPEISKFLSLQLAPGAIIIAVLHIVLIFKPMLISQLMAQFKKWRLS